MYFIKAVILVISGVLFKTAYDLHKISEDNNFYDSNEFIISLSLGTILFLVGIYQGNKKTSAENFVKNGELPSIEDLSSKLDEEADRNIRELLSRNQKIEAIKLFREKTGAGLKESKEYIDSL